MSLRQSVPSRTGVLPFVTTCFGPRTAAAGLNGTIWPVMSQSNRYYVINRHHTIAARWLKTDLGSPDATIRLFDPTLARGTIEPG